MALSFDEQVVVVTGAGRGLGRAYALELARRGARVVVNDLGGAPDGTGGGRAAASTVVDEICEGGGEAVASFDSVATPEGGEAIVRAALDCWGRVDAVIANAGILRDKTFAKLATADLDAVLDVHLRGAFFTLQPAFRAMREGGGGRLLVTTSASGLYGTFGQTNYAAAKLGLVGLMRVLALEGEKDGIRANAIAPYAATRLTGRDDEKAADDLISPARVAPMALVLVHPYCPTTGEVFLCGGGWFTRAWIATGRGWVAGQDELTPEAVLAHFDEIRDGRGATEPASSGEIGRAFQQKLGARA